VLNAETVIIFDVQLLTRPMQ